MNDERNRAYFKETFSEITAPSALVGKVLDMTENKKARSFNVKRIAIIAAAVIMVFATTGVIVYAATYGGFFNDVTNLFGAVTGTEYLNATNEVDIEINEDMTAKIMFKNPTDAPYAYISEVKLCDYRIVDANGDEVVSITDGNIISVISNGVAELPVDIGNCVLIEGNNYSLVIESFFGLSKVDAPLEIKGEWHCDFVY